MRLAPNVGMPKGREQGQARNPNKLVENGQSG